MEAQSRVQRAKKGKEKQARNAQVAIKRMAKILEGREFLQIAKGYRKNY